MIAACGVLVLAPGASLAQIQQLHSFQSGTGCTMTNGTIVNLTAGAPVAVGCNVSTNGRFANYSGFLAAVLLRSSLDTDSDGLCDEMDGDNDADGLLDDGELIADTNPNDVESVLAFLSVAGQVGGGVRIEWKGGVQARQILLRRDSTTSGAWVALMTNQPPTRVVTNFVDTAETRPASFYRIAADRVGE